MTKFCAIFNSCKWHSVLVAKFVTDAIQVAPSGGQISNQSGTATWPPYMEKTRDAGDIIPANFLDFPPNLGIFRPF